MLLCHAFANPKAFEDALQLLKTQTADTYCQHLTTNACATKRGHCAVIIHQTAEVVQLFSIRNVTETLS
jgi:hypothetical protein